MTAGELIAQLSQHSPDTTVCITVENDEAGCEFTADVYGVDRVVKADGTYIELLA